MRRYLVPGLVILGLLSLGGVSYAFRSTFTHSAVSVSSSSSTATVVANNSRNYLMLQNDHTSQNVWCKFGADAVANAGFKVYAASTIIFDSAIPKAAVNCIAQTGTTIILTTEGVQ